jgi:thiosulfate reductase cytochrome b subunit
VAHWIVALCLPILALSGLQIFNAHPALYWGDRSDRDRALLALEAVPTPDGGLRGVTRILGVEIDTTGVLGASRDDDDTLSERGFPRWATLPGEQWLALGRRWHFFFAWILAVTGVGFTVWALLAGHYTRDVVPWPRDLRGLGQSLRDHLRFRHPRGAAAARYNVMQKIAYATMLLGLGPLIVLTGLAMSPSIDAAVPFVVRGLGGRQSARTLHFVLTFAFAAFIASHVFMVVATGVVNNVRSMVTGWYRIHDEGGTDRHDSTD